MRYIGVYNLLHSYLEVSLPDFHKESDVSAFNRTQHFVWLQLSWVKCNPQKRR